MLHQHRSSVILQLLWLLLLTTLLLAVPAQSETTLLDPQYYSIAPCPCDLQASVCDVGCCCDSVCSANDKTLFDCDLGFYGGNASALELYRRCSSTDNSNPDYHPFTCVLIENYNAYLGKYFTVQAIATDWAAKRATGSAASLAGQFPVDTILGLQEASLAADKRAGLLLLELPSGVNPTWPDSRQAANNRLALPRRSLSGGGCDRSAGIAYLEDSNDACDVTISATVCSPGVASPVDANIFAIACAGGNATCNVTVSTQTASSTVVPVNVTYQALSSAVGYEKGLTGSSPSISAVSLLSPTLTGTACSNAVVDVQYRFVWNGSSLVSLAATVSMATVTLGSTVTQKFGVAYVHQSAASIATVTKRSGVVGYDTGAQLVGGLNGSDTVNSSSGYWPTLWKAGSGGACPADGSAGGDPVQFQFDASSYCTEPVTLAEFSNCVSLRQRLRSRLRAQFPASVIGIFGNANVSVKDDWVIVLEQNLTNFTGLDFASSSNGNVTPAWTEMPGLCLGLPTEIVLTVLYAQQGKANDSSIWQVVGAYLRYKQVHVAATCGPTGCESTNLMMSTGVQFVRVPSDWADNDQAFFGPYKTPCWWGICWDEIAFPLTTDFEGESRAASIAWCVFIVLIAVYAFCISRPWW